MSTSHEAQIESLEIELEAAQRKVFALMNENNSLKRQLKEANDINHSLGEQIEGVKRHA